MLDRRHAVRRRPARDGRAWRHGSATVAFVLALAPVVALAHAAWWAAGEVAEHRLSTQERAWRDAGQPTRPGDFSPPPPVPDARNAAVPLAAAEAAVGRDVAERLNGVPLDPPLSAEARALAVALVGENRRALDLADDALGRPEAAWPVALRSPVFDTLVVPDVRPRRALVRLLSASAALAHADGEPAQAVRRLRGLLRYSAAMSNRPGLAGAGLSIGAYADAAVLAGGLAPLLAVGDGGADPADVRRLIADLLDDRPLRDALAAGLLGERLAAADTARALAGGRLSIAAAAPGRPGVAALAGFLIRPLALADALAVARYVDGVNDAAATSPTRPAFDRLAPDWPASNRPSALHPIYALTPSANLYGQLRYRVAASGRLSAAALAARLWQADHGGALPESLADLVPDYLPAVPADPLADGGPIGFDPGTPAPAGADPKAIRGTDRPRVWSAGENGRDDGGRSDHTPGLTSAENRDTGDRVVYLDPPPAR